MAKRYIGDAVITIEYDGTSEDGREKYSGTVRAGGKTWKFSDLQSGVGGFRTASDSPEAYDEMARSAASFGSYYSSSNRGNDAPDWAPDPETADAIDEAVSWAQNDSGEYEVRRSSKGPAREEATARESDSDAGWKPIFERGFDHAVQLWNDGQTLESISHNKQYDATAFGRGMYAAVEALSGAYDSAEREARAFGFSHEEASKLIRSIDENGTARENHRSRAHRRAAEARGGHVEDGDYVVQGCYSDGRIAEEFGLDDEHDAVNEAVRLARSPYFEGDYVRVITRDGELVWDSRPEYAREMREAPAGMSEDPITAFKHLLPGTRFKFADSEGVGFGQEGWSWIKTGHNTYRNPLAPQGKKYEHRIRNGNVRVVPERKGTREEAPVNAGQTSLDRILDQVERGKREVTIDAEGYTPEQVDKIISAAKARGFHVSGTRRWLLIRNLGSVNETHSVHDYIAVDRNDRRVAGPFRSRHEAEGHVPAGGYVKFSSATHRKAPPAPSSYPMFREKVNETNFQDGERVRIRVIGPKGQLADPPFWYTVTGVQSVEDLALQFSQQIQPGMFVSISNGNNSWTFQKETHAGHNAVKHVRKLPTARYRERSAPKAVRSARRSR